MSTALGLAMQISANTAQLATAVSEVNKRLDEMGSAGKKAADDLSVLKNIEIAKLALGGIKAAGGAFISLSKSVVGAAQDIINFGKSVADELDALNDVANRTGVGVEALQAYGAAAKLSGTDIETFAKSIQKLTVNIGKATGSEKAQKAFTDLGLSFEDLKAKSPTEQFEAIADAISRLPGPAEQAAAAVKVFGKGGIELGPLFSEGPGALQRMREEAESLGQVVNADAVKSIAAMNDAFDKVWMTVKGLTAQIVGELAGPIGEIANDLLRVVKEVGATNIAQNVAAGLLDFIKLSGNAFFTLAKFIEGFVKKFAPILGIDIASEAEKELAKLREQRDKAQSGGFVNAGGGYGIGTQVARGPALSAEQQKRLAELESQVASEAQAGLLNSVQANFNRALDAAATNLEQRMQQPKTPGSTVASTPAVAEDLSGKTDETNSLLRDIKRDIKPPAAVEIAR